MSIKELHARKKGPGRRHKQGHKTGSKHGKKAQWKGGK
jgi:hypothetical protein